MKKNVLLIYDENDLDPLEHQAVEAALHYCTTNYINHASDYSKPTNVVELVEEIKTRYFKHKKDTSSLIIFHHGKEIASLGNQFKALPKDAPVIKTLDISLFSKVMEKVPEQKGILFPRIIEGFISAGTS